MIMIELKELNERLPEIGTFVDVADTSLYLPLPDGWLVGTSDVVDSTGAIARGQYKAVNMVGASVIAAVRNALTTHDIPFVFGGDGAAFVIPGGARQAASEALAAVSTWAEEEIGLELRTALVPIEDIRSAGWDVGIAKFAASPHVGYAMFSGGGAAWAEAQMKAGHYNVAAAPGGARPDLTGLSCRWQPIKPLRGMIASLLVLRREEASTDSYRDLVRRIITYIHDREVEEGRPVSLETAKFALSARAIALETKATRGEHSHAGKFVGLMFYYVMVWFIFATGRKVGAFDPEIYRQETIRNTDFRKFDDGLKLTIDCSQQTYDGLEAMLAEARANGIADYGLHGQQSALMTCIVPSHLSKDHMHFIDGAGGGYAKAAAMLKAR